MIKKPTVERLHSTTLEIAAISSDIWAVLKSTVSLYDPEDASLLEPTTQHKPEPEPDISKALLQEFDSLVEPTTHYKTETIIEHIVYKFRVTDISRALLQELDILESTRDTLKEFKEAHSPESSNPELIWTIKALSLKNFLFLGSSKDASTEIRNLASAILEAIPTTHQFLFEG